MEAVDAVRGEELFQDFRLRSAALLPRLPRAMHRGRAAAHRSPARAANAAACRMAATAASCES